MEIEVKQRNRRRKRAQRMQQQLKETIIRKGEGDESEAEDVVPKKPPRPPNRRKKQKDLLKEPLCEEDLVDGFSILQFRSYEDLELVIKIAAKEGIKRLAEVERPKLEPKAHITNHILVHNNHGLTLTQDPATSDDSGRASERLTGSSVAPRDADSSRDRLSDASSRCSSGKGYICDSEGEDDKTKENKEKEGHQETVDTPLTSPSDDIISSKNDDAKEEKQGSDASSVIFASAPASRKHEFPAGAALPPSNLPQSLPPHGPGSSPLPAPTPPNLPVPSPAPAQQPPNHPPQAIQSAVVVGSVAVGSIPVPAQLPSTKEHVHGAPIAASKDPVVVGAKIPASQEAITPTPFAPPQPIVAPQQPPPASVPLVAPVPQPGAAPQAAHHPTALESGAHAGGLHGPRTDSPAVATSANAAVTPSMAPSPGQYHHSYQPLYTPYAHTPATQYPISTVPPYSAPPHAPPPSITSSVPPSAIPLTPVPPQGVPPNMVPPSQPSLVQPVSNKSMLPPSMEQTRAEKRPMTPGKVSHSPRGGEPPPRERESYSNVTSLSRSSVIPTTTAPAQQHSFHVPPAPTATVSSSLTAVSATAPAQASVATIPQQPPKTWVAPPSGAPPIPTAVATRLSPAPPRPTPPLHSSAGYPPAPAMFAPPQLVPPAAVVSTASPIAPAAPPVQANPNPFSAESLFQTNQADMLRRELDNRFLASQDRALGVAPPPYLRTEMHQHQHHHTHVHQHTTSLLPPPSASGLFGSGLSPMERFRRSQSSFKDIPKLGSVDSPFYRQTVGMPGYPGYSPGLMGHPGLTTGPTPFVPPNPMSTFQPKSLTPQDPTKPRVVKSGKWNAMHVRVAWEIYHHQQKSGEAKGVLAAAAAAAANKSASDLLRTPSHLFSPGVHPASRPPHELGPYPPSLSHRPPGFDQPPHHAGSLFAAPPGHLGKSPFSAAPTMSPFTRYGGGPLGPSSTSPFSMSPFGAAARESHLALGPLHHDPWRNLSRAMPGFPPSVNPLPPSLPGLPPGPAPWTIKPDPVLEQREREAREREERERERQRREREERERREREEKQRRLEQQQQQERERERERREKERREHERRENERREREREILLHQQRLAAESAAKQMPQPVIRERSPVRNGQPDMNDIRVKEEPRIKEEDLISRTAVSDLRYHPYARHPGTLQPTPPSVLDRSRLLPPTLSHYPPAAAHWPPPHHPSAAEHFYRYGYPPHLMDPLRVPDERTGYYGHPAYAPSQLRPKDPSLMHLRGGPGPPPPQGVHKMSGTPPGGEVVHKKEEPR